MMCKEVIIFVLVIWLIFEIDIVKIGFRSRIVFISEKLFYFNWNLVCSCKCK